ncbi:MAG: class I tRNA ligase family protein, partial [Caedimonadaceae bacterium]
LHHFIWGKFCDWFIEFAKPIFFGEDGSLKTEIQKTAAWVLAQTYHFLNPFMPFITEELWAVLSDSKEPLITSSWPLSEKSTRDSLVRVGAVEEIEWIIRVISEIRASRSILNVSPAISLPLFVNDAQQNTCQRLKQHKALIERLAHVEIMDHELPSNTKGIIQCVVDDSVFLMPVGDILDVEKEKTRLAQELKKIQMDSAGLLKKLENSEFTQKAPAEILEKNKKRLAENSDLEVTLTRAIAKLG